MAFKIDLPQRFVGPELMTHIDSKVQKFMVSRFDMAADTAGTSSNIVSQSAMQPNLTNA